ncbi:hypothetical protein HKD37_01G002456 [Glycine soja]
MRNWNIFLRMCLNVTAPPEAFSQTVHAKDQIFGEVGKVYAVKWNDVLDGQCIFLSYSRPVVCPDHSQDDTLYTIKCQVLSPSRTFQVACIIFLKTKAERICT